MFKTHKIIVGFLREFVLNPVQVFLHWDSLTRRIPSFVVPEDSEMRKRLDGYLGYKRKNMQHDEDVWQRWQQDRLSSSREQKEPVKGRYRKKHGLERGEVV